MTFIEALKNSGWREVRAAMEYRKGAWVVFFDTGSWAEVGTEKIRACSMFQFQKKIWQRGPSN
ncbi:hypothetical protein [Ottowia sp.]|uniref:hypothetical protein n=1 Tax=Ottowia sp. TaxID=1898956 RepID=UPI003A86695E